MTATKGAARRGDASFLAVLKKLGRSTGVLSFPFEGYTLALDFPMTRGLLAFLDESGGALGLFALPVVSAATVAVERLSDPQLYIHAVLGS